MKKIQDTIQKIRALLEDRESASAATRVAEDYAQLCRAAEARLESVSRMLDKGSEYQALQAAEDEPALLDFIGLLSFGLELDWQHYCQRNHLPEAPRMDGAAVKRVTAIYNNPITAKHPLYKDFRSAILARDDDKALRTVRTILKLKPDDDNARRELVRLDNKQFQLKVEKLRDALRDGQEEKVPELIDELEAAATPEKLVRIDTYNEAKAMGTNLRKQAALRQLPTLLEQMQRQRQDGDWRGVGSVLEDWSALVREAGGVDAGPMLRQLDELTDYFRKENSVHQKQKTFEAALRSFVLFVEEVETRLLAGAGFGDEEVRDKDETFVRRWKELESYNVPVSSESLQRIKATGAELRARLDRLHRTKRVKFASLAAAAVLVLCALSAISLHAWKAHRLSADLADYQAQTQCVPAEELIRELRKDEQHLLIWPYLQSRIEEVSAWTKQARAAEQQAVENIQALSDKLAGNPDEDGVERLHSLLTQAEKSVKALTKDLSPPHLAKMEDLNTRVGLHLAALSKKVVEQTLAEIASIEELSALGMSFERPASKGAEELKALEAKIAPLEQRAKVTIDGLKMPEDLKLRIAVQRKKMTEFNKELESLKEAKQLLADAANYDAYQKALRSWQKLRFTEAAPAIKRLDTLPSEKTFQAQILTAGDDRLLKALEEDVSGRAMSPSEPTDSDLQEVIALRDDEKLNEVYEYQLVDYGKGERTRMIWSQGALRIGSVGSTLQWTGKYYDPAYSEKAVVFTTAPLVCRLVGTGTVKAGVEVKGSKLSPTSEMMKSLHVGNMIDDNGKYFRMPILGIMDDLVHNNSGSPLAKAYVMLKLEGLGEARAMAWGFHLCPSLATDLAELRLILGKSRLTSEDWMSSEKRVTLLPKLTVFFDKIKGRSYFQEASARRELLVTVARAGLKFGGHVDTDLSLRLNQAARNSRELWVLRENNHPSMVMNPQAGGASDKEESKIIVSNAQVLSPVFFIPLERQALIDKFRSVLQSDGSAPETLAAESLFLSPP